MEDKPETNASSGYSGAAEFMKEFRKLQKALAGRDVSATLDEPLKTIESSSLKEFVEKAFRLPRLGAILDDLNVGWHSDEGTLTIFIDLEPSPPPKGAHWMLGEPFAEQLALRIIGYLYISQRAASLFDSLRSVRLNAHVTDCDPRTGQMRKRILLSGIVNAKELATIDFDNVEPIECIDYLNIRSSRDLSDGSLGDASLTEAAQTVPGKDFDPAALSPAEFEALINDLLIALGFSSRQTLNSWDGGVDCIATDPRPVVGGTLLVQAKRYAGLVDASAVRDLYGTMHARGAGKGLLITTGRFGPTSIEFARGKPLELIDGQQLRDLIKTYLTQPN
jgi:hypothetical protein